MKLVNYLQDSAEVIENRMKMAEREMSHRDEYDYIVINDDLKKAVADIMNILNRS